MQDTYVWKNVLAPAIDAGTLSFDDAVAIYRCLFYSEQIADVSIGNMFRENVASLLHQ